MNTSQILWKTEIGQPEPQNILVESIPVEDRRKLSLNNQVYEPRKSFTWEDLLGLSFTLDEEDI